MSKTHTTDMDASEQVWEIYAHFGAAMGRAQALERTIVSAMLVFKLLPNVKGTAQLPDECEQLFDAFWEQQVKKTLGGLVTAIRALTPLPDELAAALDECNRKRIWLAHYFFIEQADALLTERGRTQMIAELVQARELFKNTVETFERTALHAWDKIGVTEQHLQKLSDHYIRQIRNDPAE